MYFLCRSYAFDISRGSASPRPFFILKCHLIYNIKTIKINKRVEAEPLKRVRPILYKKRQSVRIFVIVFAVLFLDQACKLIVLEKFADTYLKKNYSSLLGLSANLYLFFFFLLAVFAYSKKNILFKSNDSAIFAFALLFSGIISNSVDMFFYGYIIDYIIFPELFSFNIADLAICAGSLLLGWGILKK